MFPPPPLLFPWSFPSDQAFPVINLSSSVSIVTLSAKCQRAPRRIKRWALAWRDCSFGWRSSPYRCTDLWPGGPRRPRHTKGSTRYRPVTMHKTSDIWQLKALALTIPSIGGVATPPKSSPGDNLKKIKSSDWGKERNFFIYLRYCLTRILNLIL